MGGYLSYHCGWLNLQRSRQRLRSSQWRLLRTWKGGARVRCSPKSWQATPAQWQGLRNRQDGTFRKSPKKFEKTPSSRFKCAFKSEGFFINTLKYCQKPSKKVWKNTEFALNTRDKAIGVTNNKGTLNKSTFVIGKGRYIRLRLRLRLRAFKWKHQNPIKSGFGFLFIGCLFSCLYLSSWLDPCGLFASFDSV